MYNFVKKYDSASKKTTKMKKLIILLLTGFMLIPFSCEKVEIGKDVPYCIKEKIKDINVCLSVSEYIEWNPSKKERKKRIYEFSYGYPCDVDGGPEKPIFYDEECHEINVILLDDSFYSYDNIDYHYNRMVYEYHFEP